MESEDRSGFSIGWIFIVLLLFFGIFGGWGNGNGGLFGGGNSNAAATTAAELAELTALKSVNCQKTTEGHNQTDRDVLELKCNMTSQNAVLTEQLNTAFRTIITNQDAGFAALRTQQLEDQIRDRDLKLLTMNSEIMGLKSQLYTDGRFNALERTVEAGFCQTVKKPPFYPYGCTPCGTAACGCGSVTA